jgi:MarR family transcriptional regulator for hemolysin
MNWQLTLSLVIDDVARMQRTATYRQMGPQPITRTQWWVLTHVNRNDGITQRELALRMEITEGACTSIINRLRQGGWVERRVDAADRRQNFIFLTSAGRDIIHVHRGALDHVHEQIFGGMSVEDGVKIIDILSKLKIYLSELIK